MLGSRSYAWFALLGALGLAQPLEAAEPESIGTEKRYVFDSLWMKQCSILGLVTKDARRTFIFYKPEAGERAVAIQHPLLFEGANAGDHYAGKLALPDAPCAGKRVSAEGPATSDPVRVTLTISSSDLAAVCPGYGGPTTILVDFLFKGLQRPTESASTRTNNWGAVTPQAEPKDYEARGYGHVLRWPTYLPDRVERDAGGKGKVVPAFASRVAGAGLWWHWMRVRAGYPANQTITFLSLARKYAGVNEDNPTAERAAKVSAYWQRYTLYSCFYFGRRLTENDPIRLGDDNERWALAQTMFHHEAAFSVSDKPISLTRDEFESGVRLAEDFIAQRLKPIGDYDSRFR